MRVLVVVHGFPPAAQGGSEIYACEHARTLHQRHGDEVLVVTREQDAGRDDYAVRREQRNGLSIAWINNTFRHVRSFEETYRNAAIDAVADRLIAAFEPDVAHVHHLTCLSTNIVRSLPRRGVPVIYTLHDFWLMCHRGQLLDTNYRVCGGPDAIGDTACHACLGPAAGASSRAFATASVFRAIERTLPSTSAGYLRRAVNGLASVAASGGAVDQEGMARLRHMKDVCADVAIFLAPSRHIRDRFIRFGVEPGRILLSPYGFDHRPFRGSTVTSPSPHLRLGFLGSLMVSKAPHVLLEAVGRLPRGAATVDLFGAPCAYHGDDRYRSQLAPLLAQDCVRVHGPIAHEQVANALASIDVLVVPSIWPENSPLVIQEAFLAGIPVVASRIGGIPEVVTDERNGLTFEPGSVEDLTRVLRRLLEERGLIDSLRAGVPAVRTIEDDVDFTRGVYDREKRRAAAMRRRRRIAAVVLNYNTPDDTFLAVRSLLASKRRPDDIIVVDNGSTRACRDLVEPGVVYRATEKNLGFSGGVNVGIRVALDRGADAVFLVNSDVIVAADCLDHLESAAARRPDVGIVGPVVLARSEPGQVASIGISYDPVTGRMRHRHVGARASALRLAGEWDVDAVSGCSMLIKREVLDAIGLFDEDYFFTFEDLDFCLRARRVEFRTVLAGAARAYHEGSRSIGADSPARLYFAARNHLLLASRLERGRSIAATAFRAASIVVLNLAHAAISRSGSAPARFAAVASGTRDYVVRRFGDRSEAARATR